MIEIQHNTVKKMQNNYVCLLCDYDIKVKKDPVDTIELAKKHLTSSQHMQKYLVINLLSNKIQFNIRCKVPVNILSRSFFTISLSKRNEANNFHFHSLQCRGWPQPSPVNTLSHQILMVTIVELNVSQCKQIGQQQDWDTA